METYLVKEWPANILYPEDCRKLYCAFLASTLEEIAARVIGIPNILFASSNLHCAQSRNLDGEAEEAEEAEEESEGGRIPGGSLKIADHFTAFLISQV